jgi:fucose permease
MKPLKTTAYHISGKDASFLTLYLFITGLLILLLVVWLKTHLPKTKKATRQTLS